MSRLNENTTLAEQFVGVSFAAKFRDAQHVAENGGTLVGSPVVENGVTLNGSSQYVVHDLTGEELNSDTICIKMEFIPDFDWDEDVIRWIYDTEAGEFLCHIYDNSNSNTLVFYMGTVLIGQVSSATYSPYWLANERNVLIISGTSGATTAWLNGNEILSSSMAWLKRQPSKIYAGARFNGTFHFKGTVIDLTVFKTPLTEQDATHYYNNTMYKYLDDAVVNLPMLMAQHDPDNAKTLDISGNGNDAVLGDGSTSSTFPTKQSKRGYGFDGGDHLNLVVPVWNQSTPYSVAFIFACRGSNGDQAFYAEGNSGGGNPLFVIRADSTTNYLEVHLRADSGVNMVSPTLSTKEACDGLTHTLIWTDKGGNAKMYIDGILDDTDFSYTSLATTFNTSSLGCLIRSAVDQCMTGVLGSGKTLSAELSAIQAADLHLRMLDGINHV